MRAGYVAATISLVRLHRLALLLALTGCAGGEACTLVGCVSQLVVRLPPAVTAATACVGEVCTSDVVDGELRVPLSRRIESSTAQVSVTIAGEPEPYEGEVPLVRSAPTGEDCPEECVNGEAVVDPVRGQVLPMQ
jgi:hypothetical protein